jgi:hypothetical protein
MGKPVINVSNRPMMRRNERSAGSSNLPQIFVLPPSSWKILVGANYHSEAAETPLTNFSCTRAALGQAPPSAGRPV